MKTSSFTGPRLAWTFVWGILIFAAIIVLCSAKSVFSTGNYQNPINDGSPIGLSSFYAMSLNLDSHTFDAQTRTTLGDYAKNVTAGCNGDRDCITEVLFWDLRQNWQYEPGREPNKPLKIFNDRRADCDEISMVQLVMLRELNIPSEIQCSMHHCWVIAKRDSGFIISDVAGLVYEVHDE